MTILIATKNQHKAQELAALTAELTGAISLAQWEMENHCLAEPEENGTTFLANARLKARYYARATGLPTLADDSGLSVLALGRAPGVLSARYGGPGLTDSQRSQKLLRAMKGRHDRRAFFITVLALSRPDGTCLTWKGRLDGRITLRPQGDNGFGYDPIFWLAQSAMTLAQMSSTQKNEISHRARATRLFQQDLLQIKEFLDMGSL